MGISRSFDVGEVLRHAWQITWKHRPLWLVSALPMIPMLFYFPVLAYLFLSDNFMNDLPRLLNNPAVLLVSFLVLVITAVTSFLLQVFSRSTMTFGVLQVETGNAKLNAGAVFRGGRFFFWRILGTMLLASLVMTIFSLVFSACLSLIGFATLGLGSIIGQVVFLPLTLVIYAIMEQAQSAVVADGLHPLKAMERAWEVVKENIEGFAALTLLLHMGLSIAGGLATMLVAAPLLLAVLGRFSPDFVDPSLGAIALWWFVVFLPVYLLIQAVSSLYRKSVHVIAYLRLKRSANLQPLPSIGEAAS